MDLLQRRGDAHGHVHHGAQSADDQPAHQHAPQAQRRTGLAQLQQRLHVIDAQAVHTGQVLGQQAEAQGEGGAGHGAQHGAHALAVQPAQNGEADHGDEHAYGKHTRQRGHAPHQRGQQDPEETDHGEGQRHQGLEARFPSHQDRHQEEHRHHRQQGADAVILLHVDADLAVCVGGDGQDDAVPLAQRHAVQRVHGIVRHPVGLPGVLTAFDLHGQHLAAAPASVGGGIGHGLFADHGGDHTFFIFHVVRLGQLLRRLRPQPDAGRGEQGSRQRQHRDAPLLPFQPQGKAARTGFFLHSCSLPAQKNDEISHKAYQVCRSVSMRHFFVKK